MTTTSRLSNLSFSSPIPTTKSIIQWMKGSGTSRCKGCVSGPSNATTDKVAVSAEKSAAPKLKPVAAADPPSSSDAGKSSKAPTKAASDSAAVEKKTPPSSSNTTGGDDNTKSKSKTSNKNVSKVSDEKAALATITSAVSKDEVAAFSESSSSLAASANQKPGEASTEDSSKKIKVKPSDIQGDKKKGNPIGKFFGGIVRGVRSWTRPVLNPCLKMIGQQVVVTEEGGNEDLKMKEQLEKDDARKYSLKGRNE